MHIHVDFVKLYKYRPEAIAAAAIYLKIMNHTKNYNNWLNSHVFTEEGGMCVWVCGEWLGMYSKLSQVFVVWKISSNADGKKRKRKTFIELLFSIHRSI